MRRFLLLGSLLISGCVGCTKSPGTAPPSGGWANTAPTQVAQVVDRKTVQLLEVTQGSLRTWVLVPHVGAKAGDYILLGQGAARLDVEIPELGQRVPEVVDIKHARVVDLQTAQRTIAAKSPRDAVAIGTIYAELAQRADKEIVVYGTVVKANDAIGWMWVHLRDGTGDPSAGTDDLTVKTEQRVTVGQRVAFRGVLRSDVDLGFGYHYDALVEEGELIR